MLTTIRQYAAGHWRGWLVACWAASSAVLGAFTWGRIIRLRGAVWRATVPGRPIAPQIQLLVKRLGIRRVPRVRFIVGSPPPMLLALFCRPELVIPIDLWDRLDDRQRQTLLLHELAHLRRGDHWVRYLEMLATCVYWWHFATWFARRTLHEAEEYCCDAWVVWALPDSCSTYMTTLLDTVDFLSQEARPRLAAKPVLASGMGQFHHLQRRLAMVRERNTQRRLGAGGLAAVVLPIGAKLASGEDRGAAQAAAATPPTGTAFAAPADLAPVQDPTERAGESPKAPADAGPSAQGSTPFAQPVDEVSRLEAELAAARDNVERIRKQLEAARGKLRRQRVRTPEARLGYILFKYQGTASGGTVLAYHGPDLMWKLDVPLNADSGIRCYDNDTLLISSADGYTRLITAEDGHVIKVWAPGAQVPVLDNGHSVNPFLTSGQRSIPAPTSSPKTPAATSRRPVDQEQRMERIEQSIRSLTEAVQRLAREQKDQPGSSSAPQTR